jgi:hypothetical protein
MSWLSCLSATGRSKRRASSRVSALLRSPSGNRSEASRQFARLRLGHVAERKAQKVELLGRGREQEIALVTVAVAGPVERAAAVRQPARGDVMAGRQHLGAKLARGAQEIAELDRLVAFHAGHRRLARHVAVGEAVDDRRLEAALVVEHVMGNADPLRDRPRVMDVLAGAAGALAVGRGAVVVKLQRHPDDVVAFILEQRRRNRGIHAPRHGHDHAGILRPPFEVEAVSHGGRGLKPRSLAPPSPVGLRPLAVRHLNIGNYRRECRN